jgi:hypothetical protein
MEKIIATLENYFKHDYEKEKEQYLNNLMRFFFKDKSTATSIELFKEFQKKFENEIAKKGMDGLVEHTICEEYFDKKS